MKRVLTIWLALFSSLILSGSLRAELASQIVVNPSNPAWLVRFDPLGNHHPFFMAGPGDPEGFLYRGSLNADGTRSGDQSSLTNRLASTGANSIYMQIVRSHGGDGDATHNPFVGHIPANGLNEAVLDQWEGWFTAMDNAGITAYVFLYDDSARPFGSRNRVIGEDETAFIEGIVNRFEHHKNLIWNVAEEYSEAHSQAVVRQMASIIRNADDNNHVIAVHQHHGIAFDFPNDPYIDQFAIQSNSAGASTIHDEMVSAFDLAAGRYNLNMSESNKHFNASDPDRVATRQYSWAAAMGGSYVMVLGMDIEHTPIEILKDHGRMVKFFEQTNFQSLAPHDGLGFAATDDLLADPGNAYIAFTTDSTGGLGIKETRAGIYDFLWFDTVTGETAKVANRFVPGGDQVFTPPATIGRELAVWMSPSAVPEPPVLPMVVTALGLSSLCGARRYGRRRRLRQVQGASPLVTMDFNTPHETIRVLRVGCLRFVK